MIHNEVFQNFFGDGTAVELISVQGVSPESIQNQVFKITLSDTDSTYAIKSIPLEHEGEIQPFIGSPEHQLYQAVGDQWKANRLLTPLAYWHDEENQIVYLVLPFLEGQTLEDTFKQTTNLAIDGTRLGLDTAASFVNETTIALSFLRKQNLVHGELEDRHVMMTPEGRFFLFDFENATEISQETSSYKEREYFSFFELVARLLLSQEKSQEIIDQLNFVMLSATIQQYENISEFDLLKRHLPAIYALVAKTPAEITHEHQARLEKYGLTNLALEIPDYLFILASATEAIEESFGAELAQVFSRHIESSFSDSAWNFTDFAEEFDQAVNKISK